MPRLLEDAMDRLVPGSSLLLDIPIPTLSGIGRKAIGEIAERGSRKLMTEKLGRFDSAEKKRVIQTIERIDGKYAPPNPGRPFANKENHLPSEGSYFEYRVRPPHGQAENLYRIVRDDKTGNLFYSWTHYGERGNTPFIRIR